MTTVKFFNPTTAPGPYKNYFHNVAIVPPNTSIAYVSTQWAVDPETGDLTEGVADDYGKQAAIVWTNIVKILRELEVELKDVVHKVVSFKEYNDDIGKACIESMLNALPDEWEQDAFTSALTFDGGKKFHLPGIVFTLDIIVAVPARL